MKAIIITEHSEFDLSPLTDRIPHPLLPVAGKTLLMHALEILHHGSVRRVEVVSPSLHRRLADATDTGPLLGMEVSFVPDVGDPTQWTEHCLVVGLTNILDVDWNNEVDRLGDLKVHALIPIRMTVCAMPVALLIPPHSNSVISDNWSDVHMTEAIHLPVGPKRVLSTTSIREFHQSNCDLLRGRYHHLKPAGREIESGRRAAPKARINSRAPKLEYGYFGSKCRVDRTAALSGHVVIGDRAVVAKGAHIQDSIILDNSYIGTNINCSRAIVDRDLLIKVDTGVCLRVEDPALLGSAA